VFYSAVREDLWGIAIDALYILIAIDALYILKAGRC